MELLKKYVFLILICIIILPVSSWGAVTFTSGVWSTTFNCSEWVQYSGGSWYSMSCDNVDTPPQYRCVDTYTMPGLTATSYQYTEITSDANYSSGGGGRGYRLWQGHTAQWDTDSGGGTNNSGYSSITFNTLQDEFWVRTKTRWQNGWAWTGLYQEKFFYIFCDSGMTAHPLFIFPYGQNGADMALLQNGTGGERKCTSGCGWTTMYPTATSDGSWHSIELHLKKESVNCGADGVFQFWLDGVLKIDYHDVRYVHANDCSKPYSSTGFRRINLGGNAGVLTNGQPNCMYHDYDDIVVANTSYTGFVKDAQGNNMIGPIGGARLGGAPPSPPSPPQNLRIIP
jgi:hypothetical protein